MKILILVRHAKSSWNLPIIDKERPLIDSGIQAIQKIGLASISLLPKGCTIWSSTAKRASETAILYCKSTFLPIENIIYKNSLYTFDENSLEKEIKKCDDTINNLILFGHNEAITNFVNKFGDKIITNVPTAGFVFLQFEQNNWEKISKGKTIKTLFPKEL